MNNIRIPKFRLRGLLCFALLSLLISSCGPGPSAPADSSNGIADPNSNGGNAKNPTQTGRSSSKFSALDAGSFIVDNESSQSLGEIEISGSTQNIFIVVGANEADTVVIPFTAQSVTIASQVCLFPKKTIIQLVNGSQIQAEWQSSGLIKIIDYGEQN